jgi:RNA polymerase sigma factor (sigma-70 family)
LSPTSNIPQLTDHLFRYESGKMIAVLVRIFGTENLELAEDVVQDTFITAINTWSLKGIPDNPSAWLFRTAKNKAIDLIRRSRFTQQFDFSDSDRALLQSEYTLTVTIEARWIEASIQDDLLRMMFACCHQGISAEGQITLMLKTLCGFSIAEIARAFFSTEQTITKRLYRTREFFRAQKIKPEFPDPVHLPGRTAAVLRAVYLIFNEGYNATHNDDLIRKDLLEQAMYLCRMLCNNHHTKLPEAYAAMALMCFHAARVDSRLSTEGDIILLASQDRSKWDVTLIHEGNDYLNKAAFGQSLSTYHIEAAIAYEHCTAQSFAQTDWPRILVYYDWLAKLNPSPVILLNRASVIHQLKGPDQALTELESSPHLNDWEQHYLYHSLLGEIYSGKDKAKAQTHYQKAADLTQSKHEKSLLQKKITQLGAT